MSAWTWAWLAWFAWFAVVEGMALFNSRPGDTLSEHVWAWFGTQRRRPGEPERPRSGWTQLRRFLLIAFMAWLSAHFITGGWV
ncbi:hypothetical protein AWW66_03230 [Micromonospora rosaria]|uniref:Uncharacterized protein n=1 Tax=Micromonospora rosaria TaxID=47874 RepID=A0A136PXY4_9ACTN|nr:hypothetical protein [Micromonospora rosaria]KXK63339.1 hypothetical protein AWW66_03230 [Micromonospora rosaria]